jgi:hypothetical protein
MFFSKKEKEMTLEEVTTLLDGLKIPTALVFTPINLASEKKKFFNSDSYNPQFRYRVVKNNNDAVLRKLLSVKEISNVDPRISRFYIDLIQAKKQISDLMHVVGDNEAVTEISKNRFKIPSAMLFRNACRVLRGNVSKYNLSDKIKGSEEMLQYDDIVKAFDIVFEELGLDGWSVKPSINISKNGVKVGVKKKEILVDKNIERSKFKLRKTIVHEVGVHALRAHNGLNSGFVALSKPNLATYLDVEEGFATWNEYNMGLLTERWLINKAALVYAIYIGEDLTFRELYNSVLGILPKKSAFDTVYRVKRGLGDTSEPGIYAKDVAYFRGFRKVLRRLDNDPTLYTKLYAGKIDFKQCNWVEEGLIKKPQIVPTKEKWAEIFEKANI